MPNESCRVNVTAFQQRERCLGAGKVRDSFTDDMALGQALTDISEGRMVA